MEEIHREDKERAQQPPTAEIPAETVAEETVSTEIARADFTLDWEPLTRLGVKEGSGQKKGLPAGLCFRKDVPSRLPLIGLFSLPAVVAGVVMNQRFFSQHPSLAIILLAAGGLVWLASLLDRVVMKPRHVVALDGVHTLKNKSWLDFLCLNRRFVPWENVHEALLTWDEGIESLVVTWNIPRGVSFKGLSGDEFNERFDEIEEDYREFIIARGIDVPDLPKPGKVSIPLSILQDAEQIAGRVQILSPDCVKVFDNTIHG